MHSTNGQCLTTNDWKTASIEASHRRVTRDGRDYRGQMLSIGVPSRAMQPALKLIRYPNGRPVRAKQAWSERLRVGASRWGLN